MVQFQPVRCFLGVLGTGALLVPLLSQGCRPIGKRVDAALLPFESFDFAARSLPSESLRTLSLQELRGLRGIVFGRHGRVFSEKDIQEYLRRRPWYHPDLGFDNQSLGRMERRNLDRIREAEARKHPHVEPGDLRFWRERSFTRQELGRHSVLELRVMRAEIEAIHGARFDEDPAMQQYFQGRYWYRPEPGYESSVLSPVEHQNIQVILWAIREQHPVPPVYPGEFLAGEVHERCLRNLDLYELAVLRSEIQVRQGVAPPSWLREWFSREPALVPLRRLDRELELRNLAVIRSREAGVRHLHEGPLLPLLRSDRSWIQVLTTDESPLHLPAG